MALVKGHENRKKNRVSSRKIDNSDGVDQRMEESIGMVATCLARREVRSVPDEAQCRVEVVRKSAKSSEERGYLCAKHEMYEFDCSKKCRKWGAQV